MGTSRVMHFEIMFRLANNRIILETAEPDISGRTQMNRILNVIIITFKWQISDRYWFY